MFMLYVKINENIEMCSFGKEAFLHALFLSFFNHAFL